MHLNTDLKNFIKKSTLETELAHPGYRPQFFRTTLAEDADAFLNLLRENAGLKVFDSINNQLKDLLKSLNPSRVFEAAELELAIDLHLAGTERMDYGVWVYYPWINSVVHMLDEQEFIEVRTNRNKHKITQAEQELLARKKIGVIGLSVGQSVSLTLAIERGCGELRIADFDVLDLTNLNRIRSGVHNVNLKKTVIVAREIAEIDPFFQVTCFHEGINEHNIDTFLTGQGKLDLLIDECDGIDIKILCRTKAKSYQIPVLMEASDRGTIDIERFDLEPERPILHGRIEHLDLSKVKHLKTNEEKVPYILPIAGVETLSTRMKASMLEIQQTITSWPQLASAVTYGGGITADLARRILLDRLHVSGRFFVDMDEIIADPVEDTDDMKTPLIEKGISFDTITASIDQASYQLIPEAVVLSAAALEEIMSIAQRASSAGNNQPWKWFYQEGKLFLFHDTERSFSFANQDDSVANIAFGLALESIRLKAQCLNLNMEEQVYPDPLLPNLVAVLQFTARTAPIQDTLARYTDIRHTGRNIPKINPAIKAELLREMQEETSKVEGAKLHLLSDQQAITAIAGIMGEADKLRLFTPTGHHELFNLELRWNKAHSQATGDGLDLESFELTPGEAVGMRIAKDPKVMQLLKAWKGGAGLERLSRKSGLGASAIALITMPAYSAKDFINGGKAAERLWLAANKNNIALHPMTASILHFNVLKYGQGLQNDVYLQEKFGQLSSIFYQQFNEVAVTEVPVFLCRLFYAEKPTPRTERLPLTQIFKSKHN